MDKANFELRLSKCEALNQERIKRALQIMKNDVVNVLNVLPVLLHYNSPNLPGYRSSSVPFGIDRFTPTEYQRRYLIDHGIDPDTKIPQVPIDKSKVVTIDEYQQKYKTISK